MEQTPTPPQPLNLEEMAREAALKTQQGFTYDHEKVIHTALVAVEQRKDAEILQGVRDKILAIKSDWEKSASYQKANAADYILYRLFNNEHPITEQRKELKKVAEELAQTLVNFCDGGCDQSAFEEAILAALIAANTTATAEIASLKDELKRLRGGE